ncbi:hypothetical protein Ais01nite_53540 [Asanoa ishikariensis]|uniref:Uncharacterized protein n=1 Tax=Asanoa ishikariensis TaxID=137265 RepID=A0A1H3RD86_9ACTN|nr:hypothetical protein [Asanoa ishikariensis]GIF67319.1 hypothetical protein Ais01nite_53540 [Asanoa ishikariensis]SDZ23600.1 hypothetical protein SAMN05421684_3723 [Asanoa ishikariensis]
MSDKPHHDAAPGELLASMADLRRRTRAARHAYWFPLILFGLLMAAALPFYLESAERVGMVGLPGDGPLLAALGGDFLEHSTGLGWYWLVALLAGFLISLGWYRWRGERTGLRTPTRAYLRAGVIGTLAGVLLPVVLRFLLFNTDAGVSGATSGVTISLLGVANRGMFPHLVIAVGLLVLARLERSRALLVVTLCFTAAVVAVNGWFHLSEFEPGDLSRWSFLLAAVPPAVILLVGGTAALLTRRPA